MTKPQTFKTRLPFSGFYDSIWSYMIESQEESFADYEAEENKKDVDAIRSALFDSTDYSAAYREIAENFPWYFSREVESRFDVKLALTNASLYSPRFYNFETDEITVTTDRQTLANVLRLHRADNWCAFESYLADHYVSRSGFASFYDDFANGGWREKPVSEWDDNEISALFLSLDEMGNHSESIERTVYDEWADCGYTEWQSAVDWEKYDSLMIKEGEPV